MWYICVVRYMDRNREITRIKREEIRRLKEHLTLLQQRLERYGLSTDTPLFSQGQQNSPDSHSHFSLKLHPFIFCPFHFVALSSSLHLCYVSVFSLRYLSYGSGPKRFPLADVLQYAMEFASSKPVCTSPVEDIDTSAPPGGTTGQQLPPPRCVLQNKNGLKCVLELYKEDEDEPVED